MKKERLTLLIALSILILLILPFTVLAQENSLTTSSQQENLSIIKVSSAIISSTIEISAAESVTNNNSKLKPKKEKEIVKKSQNNIYTISSKASSFKSWMPWTAITNKHSAAYKLQQQAYTDKNGLRKVGNDYCVAMGTYYSSTIGDRFKITMSTGNSFTIIISDIKSNNHTNSSHQYTISNGCMMEFLVDKNNLASCVKTSGNVGSIKMFSGKFTKVEKLS